MLVGLCMYTKKEYKEHLLQHINPVLILQGQNTRTHIIKHKTYNMVNKIQQFGINVQSNS